MYDNVFKQELRLLFNAYQKKHGLNRKQMSELFGVGAQNFLSMALGTSHPTNMSANHIPRIREILGLSLDKTLELFRLRCRATQSGTLSMDEDTLLIYAEYVREKARAEAAEISMLDLKSKSHRLVSGGSSASTARAAQAH